MTVAVLAVAGALILLLIVVVATSVRIVRPYQKGIIEQLGKYKETKDSGLHLILPFVQKMQLVDMREQVVDVPPQEVITSDNVVVSVDAVIYYEPTDPQRLIYNIANFFLAITKLAQTNLRNVIGDLTLDQALTSRDKLNMELRQILDDATDKWGVRVARVEIQRIDPPQDVMSAMHEQMKAERTRRAQVTSADGFREAAIMKAEGEKQAAILTAEGVKQRQVLEAQGQAEAVQTLADAERYRAETVAVGEANATRNIYQAIHDGEPTNDLLAIKYLEALQGIANGQATKIYLPLDTGGVYGSLAGIAELFNGAGEADAPAAGEPRRPRSSGLAVEPPTRIRPAAATTTPAATGTSTVGGTAGGPWTPEQRAAGAGTWSTSLAEEAVAAAGGAVVETTWDRGWYPDPSNRHPFRYWDGDRWTSRVAVNDIGSGETSDTP